VNETLSLEQKATTNSALAEKFSAPSSSTINTASTVMVLLALGWAFTFFGQLMSRRAQAVDPQVDKVPQTAVTD
jgi:hypothetical protein